MTSNGFTLRVHVARLRLLAPLQSASQKMSLRIKGDNDLNDLRTVKNLTVTSDLVTRENGYLQVNEDLEFKMGHASHKISIYVYATRTFKEDLLLFYNDVSLRKPLATTNIVKIEAKLYNSDKIMAYAIILTQQLFSDKVHVANIYLEMQRKGPGIAHEDFMSELTQKLNLEAANQAKLEADFPRKQKKKHAQDDSVLDHPPSTLEVTQQMFGIPQLGFTMREERAKAIPVFDPFLMGDNFQRFLKSLDGLVYAYEFVHGVITLEGDTRFNILWLVLFSNVILWWEMAVSLMPIGMAAFVYFNLYRKRKYVRPSADILKNMRFIQLAMGHFSDMVHLIYSFIEDYLFWGQPDRTHELLRELIKIPLPLALTLYFFPFRIFFIFGLWGAAMAHSPFCVSMFNIMKDKGLQGYKETYRHYTLKVAQTIFGFYQSHLKLNFSYLSNTFERWLEIFESLHSFMFLLQGLSVQRTDKRIELLLSQEENYYNQI